MSAIAIGVPVSGRSAILYLGRLAYAPAFPLAGIREAL